MEAIICYIEAFVILLSVQKQGIILSDVDENIYNVDIYLLSNIAEDK